MGDDDILTAVDGSLWSFDAIKVNGFLEGHAPGVKLAGGYLRGLAVELFKDGKDAEAIAMRKLAEEMEAATVPDCEKRWHDHQKVFPDMIKPAPARPATQGERKP